MNDLERDQLYQLCQEAYHLTRHLMQWETKHRLRWPLRVRRLAETRLARREQNLRNLDALRICDSLDPSDLHELADRC